MRKKIGAFLSRLTASTFARRLGVLLSGTVLAQALPVLAAPALSRLYTPGQLGEYALFASGVNILSQLACLKYDFAILTAGDDQEAASLTRLSVRVCMLLSLGLCAVLPFARPLSALMGTEGTGWVIALPLATGLTGLGSVYTYAAMRQGRYAAVTGAGVLRSALAVGVQLGLSRSGLAEKALILGQLVSYGAAWWFLRYSARDTRVEVGRTQLRAAAKANRAFPLYTLPGALCNAAATGVTSFFLSAWYSPAELGSYSLVSRVLTAPLALVASTTGQVYAKELADARDGRAGTVFRRVSGALAVVSLPCFALLFLFAEPFVRIVFGPQWESAVPMLRILLPLAAVRLVVSPVSSTGVVLGRQRPTMVWQAALLGAALLPAAWRLAAGLTLQGFLLMQTVLLTACYLIFWIYCALLVRRADGGFTNAMG